ENNVQRIVLEMLAVTLSKDARARAVQLPAWNEALGLPRPWDQQWSLRLQQVLAYETDLLEYDDLFTGSVVVEQKVAERDQAACDKALDALREAAGTDTNLMAATLDCARAGVTTGEWAGVLREVFGEYRAPTGVAAASGGGEADETLIEIRERVKSTG